MLRGKRIIAAILAGLILLVSVPAVASGAGTLGVGVSATAWEQQGRYPVILVPGLGGTELYSQYEKVWINTWRLLGSHLPFFNLFNFQWLMPLRLKADGVTPHDARYRIQTGDIMRNGLTDAYSGMVVSLEAMGWREGRDLRVFPYDWRMDLSSHVNRLSAEVDELLRRTGAPQVILIGHSQGGLLIRDYLVRTEGAKVKATISVGTPWMGAPAVYRSLKYGWDMGVKIPGTRWSVLAPHDVKVLAQNFANTYQLAPNRHFFVTYGGYVGRNGRTLSFEETLNAGLVPHNELLARRGAQYYDRILDGNSYGAQQFLLAGMGRNTPAYYREGNGWFEELMTDGDEVVPIRSADLGYRGAAQEGAIGEVQDVAYIWGARHLLLMQEPAVRLQVLRWIEQVHSPAGAAR